MSSSDTHDHFHDQHMIQAIVDYQGFALWHVADRPPLTHTIGLYSPDNGRPELLISGLSVHRRVEWMLDLGFQVNGPPSQRAREEASEATGIPLAEFVYPAGGAVFTPGGALLSCTSGITRVLRCGRCYSL